MTDHKITVSVASLQPSQFSGWGTKQGGKWKSWKRRFFVLKDRKLWYFENEKSTTAKGWIDLPPGTDVKDESERPKKLAFSINSRGVKGLRTFHLTVDTEEDFTGFFTGLSKVLGSIKHKTKAPEFEENATLRFSNIETSGSGPENLVLLNNKFSWLNIGQTATLLEIARTSLPQQTSDMEFSVCVNSSCNSLGLRMVGPQSSLTQSVVDTFWSVGTAPSEFERLNMIGIKMDPLSVGLWLDLSEKGGMDGGWYMLTEHPLQTIELVSDGGKINDKLELLLDGNGINKIDYVARDLGVTPPRQTEFRFKVSGHDRAFIVKDIYDKLRVKGFNLLLQKVINDAPTKEVIISVKTTNFDLVKISTIIEYPSAEIIRNLLSMIKGFYYEKHSELIKTFGNPISVEYSFLQIGFGYEVFNEGFDVSLCYNLQEHGLADVSVHQNIPSVATSSPLSYEKDFYSPREVSPRTSTYAEQNQALGSSGLPPLPPHSPRRSAGSANTVGSGMGEAPKKMPPKPSGAPARPAARPPKPAPKPKISKSMVAPVI
ncbi:PH domain-containing protein [Entamoeba marina]